MRRLCAVLTVTVLLTSPATSSGAAVRLLEATVVKGTVLDETGVVRTVSLVVSESDRYFLVTRSDLDACNATTAAYHDCEAALGEMRAQTSRKPALEDHLNWTTQQILTITVTIAGAVGLASGAILKLMD